MLKKSLTSFDLKIIAIIAMLIDHIGTVFIEYPIVIPFRIIGRITAPVMAFFIVEGYHYTKDVNKYIKRLFIFALISQVPFMLLFGNKLNVLFTYLIAIIILEFFYKIEDKFISISFISILLTLSLLTDWGIIGVLFVLIFHIFRENKIRKLLCFSLIVISNSIYLCISSSLINIISLASLFAIIFILLYNNKRGKKLKYFFYAFYPIHMLILFLIKYLIK